MRPLARSAALALPLALAALASGGLDAWALTLVAPLPPALPLFLAALAGLAVLRARGRGSTRSGR